MSRFLTLSRLFLNVQRLRLIQKSLDLCTICAILRPIGIGTRFTVQANRVGHRRPTTPARTAVSDIVCAAMGARCVIFSRRHNRTTYNCNRLTKTWYRRGDHFYRLQSYKHCSTQRTYFTLLCACLRIFSYY